MVTRALHDVTKNEGLSQKEPQYSTYALFQTFRHQTYDVLDETKYVYNEHLLRWPLHAESDNN